MNKPKYFSPSEKLLWLSSVGLILFSFFLFDKENYLALVSSLLGVTSLIFCAKGNPFGQVLMIVFSLFYGAISYTFAYYGEMITYLGMTLPMSVFALVSWLKNPYDEKKSEVRVRALTGRDIWLTGAMALVVTVAFYFILKHFNTANLLPSTVSVTTSFVAVALTYLRSPYFALAYATNDMVLIVLWVLASVSDTKYISVAVCFVAFLANDIYGYINWQRMKRRQAL